MYSIGIDGIARSLAELRISGLDGTGATASAVAIDRQDRPAITVGQVNHIARVNQVRVVDLRIDFPDFRPAPRLAQETRGNVPEGIPLDDRVAVRVIGLNRRRLGKRGDR